MQKYPVSRVPSLIIRGQWLLIMFKGIRWHEHDKSISKAGLDKNGKLVDMERWESANPHGHLRLNLRLTEWSLAQEKADRNIIGASFQVKKVSLENTSVVGTDQPTALDINATTYGKQANKVTTNM